jgi:hypothetical protein
MKRSPIVVATVLFITAHRLPAPIQEIQESPTPVASVAETPKPKQKAKTPATPKSRISNEENFWPQRTAVKPTPTPAAPFAGEWRGALNDGRTRTILINPSQSTVTIDGGPWGRETGIVEEANGSQLSWTTTPLSVHVKWTLSLLQGGKIAQVATRHFLGGETGTFEKKQ